MSMIACTCNKELSYNVKSNVTTWGSIELAQFIIVYHESNEIYQKRVID